MGADDVLTILVPVDVSGAALPNLDVLDHLGDVEVVLLGYFPVPDQAEPALIKAEYHPEAADRLDSLAGGRPDVTAVLVFTHDRRATIDRVADGHGADAVLTAGSLASLDRILVPLRGDANLERIVSVVADLARESDAEVTLFHAVEAEADPSGGEFLLQGAVDWLEDHGLDAARIDRRVVETADPEAAVARLGEDHDLVVLGESEPTLRARIIGDFQSRVIDDLDGPALIVRTVE